MSEAGGGGEVEAGQGGGHLASTGARGLGTWGHQIQVSMYS